MITDRVVALLGYRMHLINLSFCTPCIWSWDRKRMKPSGMYSHCNYWLILLGASIYTADVTYRIYTNQRAIFREAYEDERVYLTFSSGKRILASLIYLAIDSLAWVFITNLILIAILVSQRREMVCHVVNGILDMNEWLTKELHRHNGFRPRGRGSNSTQFYMTLIIVGSLIMPVFYGLAVLHAYEPVHRSLQDWFEVEPKPELRILPVIIVVDYGLLFCSNAITILLLMAVIYIGLCNFWIPGITPKSLVMLNGRPRYSTEVGLVDAKFLIKVYRAQQIINLAINDIVKSKRVSMHHAMMLGVFVLSVYLCISYSDDVGEMGVAGLVVPLAALVTVAVEYYETHLLGNILSNSRMFIRAGRRLTIRGSPVLSRFFRSCTDIKLRTAYPFFVVSYDTFLLLVNQGIDFLVSLLVFSK